MLIVPDLVFSEIDFLNSNPSRKRRNQNEDDQRNGSIRRKTVHKQDASRDSVQDTDETFSLHDYIRRKSHKALENEQVFLFIESVSFATFN